MNNQFQEYRDAVRFNQVIYFGILIGFLIFVGIGLGIRSVLDDPLDEPAIQVLNYIALLSLLVFIPLGFWMHSQRMKKIPAESELTVKFYHFRSSFIMKLAMFETCGILGIIVMILGGQVQVLLQLGIVLVAFLLNYPSIYKYKTDLGLTEEEVKRIRGD
jgi:cytochrome bd-type quinol oxidase subunit 2